MSFVGKIFHDSNKAPDSPPHPHTISSNQCHCFYCKDVLGDGEFCQQYTCMRCESGLSKGLCLICASRYGNNPNPNSLNDSLNISENVSQSPPLIDHHCCYGCGDSLDGIFCQQYTCENGDHYGYNCPPQVLIISNPEPCNNQTVDELPQTLPSFDSTCYSGDRSSFTYDSTPNSFDNPPDFSYPPPQPQYVPYSCELCGNDAHHGYDCPPQVPFVYNQDPCFNQNFDYFPQTSPSFPQQYPCCEDCGGPHETFQCQPMNYYEPNPCYDSNYSGFDQFEPPQFPVIHQPIREKTCAELLAEERAANINTQPMQYSVVHQPPQEETSLEFLQDQRNLINSETIPEIEHAFEDKQYQPEGILELFRKLHNDVQNIHEELVEYINTPNWNRPIVYYNDDDDEDYTIATTPDLSTEEPDNSLSIGDEHLDTIPETESDEVIKSSVEDHVPIPNTSIIYFPKIDSLLEELAGELAPINPIPLGIHPENDIRLIEQLLYDDTSSDDDSYEDIDYVDASPPDSELVSLEEVKDFHTEDGEIEDDILREKLSKINLLIAKIEALNTNPTPSSDFVTKSPSTFLNFFLEETNTFDNSLPESETFCFDLEENSSGSTTTRSDYSLPDYEAFYFDDDHIEEKSSGSTTTHSDISLSKYDSFIFDLSNDPFPPADRSDFYHEEFADELAHIISPPEYDCFYFKSKPDPGELTSIVDPEIRDNVLSTTNVNLPFEDDQSPLFAYVVWIFLPFLTYPVTPPYLFSSGNEDTIFDPDISIYNSFIPGVSYRSGTFMKFNVYPNHLNESPMEILSSTCSPMDQ
ncbi:hypothetical protein Tco_1274993 [Tanacetum coccineum]